MKTLFLIRHAHSGRKSGVADDSKRPLSDRGKAEAAEMGKRLKKRGVNFDAFYSSVAKRAYDTARIIAGEVGVSVEDIVRDEGFYTFDVERLLSAVRSVDDGFSTVAVFCHNFAVSGVANLLAGAEIEMPTCGVVHIETGSEKWSGVSVGEGRMVEFDFPGRDKPG